jgi:hypothetical protein
MKARANICRSHLDNIRVIESCFPPKMMDLGIYRKQRDVNVARYGSVEEVANVTDCRVLGETGATKTSKSGCAAVGSRSGIKSAERDSVTGVRLPLDAVLSLVSRCEPFQISFILIRWWQCRGSPTLPLPNPGHMTNKIIEFLSS